MSNIIKPGEALASPAERMAVKIDELMKVVQAQGQLLGLFDQYMLMNKKFFDQIKINEPPKVEEKKEEKK